MSVIKPDLRKLEICANTGRCMAHPKSYESYAKGSSWFQPSQKQIAEYALKALEAAWKADIEIHERNIPIIKANEEARQEIISLMDKLGVPPFYYETPRNSRARFPKKTKVDAGYLGDIQRNFPIDDGFARATQTYERLKVLYLEYAADAEKKEELSKREAEAAKNAKLDQRRKDIQLAKILIRYDLSEDSSWDDILERLREKNQRIDLAVAMLKTRGDWSEGFYRVASALQRFVVANEEDALIKADILSCFNCDDGRVFRDTTWNYDRLFASVPDSQLVEDVKVALSYIKDY